MTDLEEREMGSEVVKRVRNQLLAYRFVWMACTRMASLIFSTMTTSSLKGTVSLDIVC
jgi:hypothetical protein